MITDRSHAPTRCCYRTGIHLTPGSLCSAPSLKRGPRNVRTGECCLAKRPHEGFRGVCGVVCAPPQIDAASLCNSIETSCYCNLLFRSKKTPQNPRKPRTNPTTIVATCYQTKQCTAMPGYVMLSGQWVRSAACSIRPSRASLHRGHRRPLSDAAHQQGDPDWRTATCQASGY